MWLEPQRTNFIANPSFEDATLYGWRWTEFISDYEGEVAPVWGKIHFPSPSGLVGTTASAGVVASTVSAPVPAAAGSPTVSLLTNKLDSDGTASITTASVTPTAGRLVFAVFSYGDGVGSGLQPTSFVTAPTCSGLSATWRLVQSHTNRTGNFPTVNGANAGTHNLAVFAAGTSWSGSGTVTLTGPVG
jgi:hypothetical protein